MITLTLVIPTYNEEKRVTKCLDALRAFRSPTGISIDQVIFVDDGSKDKTRQILTRAKLPYKKLVLGYKQNMGRGYALRRAMTEATGDYALWLDADMSTPLDQITHFLPSIKKGIPVMTGSRKIKGAKTPIRQPLYRILLGHGFSALSGIILNVPVGDFTCGFKAFNREAYTRIFPLTKINRWGNDCETLFLAKKFGMPIRELPVTWNNDPRTKVKVLRDIVLSLAELCRIRLYDLLGNYDQQISQPAYETT